MAARYQDRRSFRDYYYDLMDDTYFEINGRMVDLLPKFRGTCRDNPLIHLRDVQVVCDALRPREVGEAEFMIRMFPYSLNGYAQSWLFSLLVDSMPKWEQMRQLFLKQYSYNQHPQETTYEYLEYYKDWMATCPDNSLPEFVLILNFLDGMKLHEREMMDTMAGGSIMDCYPEEVWDLIYKRAVQTKPYGFPESTHSSPQEETHVITPEWEHRMQETSYMLTKLAKPEPQVISIVPEEQSLPQESASRPLAQTERTANPIVQPHNEETCNTQTSDERNTPVKSDDLDSHAKDLISSLCIVGTCTTDFLVMPDYFLSYHVQDHELGVSFGVEKVLRSSEEMCRKIMCIILGESVSLFLRHKRRRHSMFGWKPGWITEGSTCGTHNKRVKRICRKFDGVHPWAPNL